MSEKEMRELDAWIHEHVFGWEFTDDPEQFTMHDRPLCFRYQTANGALEVLRGDAYAITHAPKGTPFNRTYKKFHPTTDAAAALEVLRACGERTGPEGLAIEVRRPGPDSWYVCAFDYEIKASAPADAPTLELAICLFAKALFSTTLAP